jgi:hypothetical protein
MSAPTNAKEFAQWFKKGSKPETAFYVEGGKLVVPGHAKTARGRVGLITRAVKAGTLKVKPKSK